MWCICWLGLNLLVVGRLCAEGEYSRHNLYQLEEDTIFLAPINAPEYEFLVLISEFGLLQGLQPCHFNNCAECLNMKCGIAPGTAREKCGLPMRCLI